MTKRELIHALEALECSDATSVDLETSDDEDEDDERYFRGPVHTVALDTRFKTPLVTISGMKR